MTTLNINPQHFSANDFVLFDTANLAFHMDHCASAQSPFFALHSALQTAHQLVCTHFITVVALVAIGVGLLALV